MVNAAATFGLSAASSADIRPSLSWSSLRKAAADVSIAAKRIFVPGSGCVTDCTCVDSDVWAATMPALQSNAAALMPKVSFLMGLPLDSINQQPLGATKVPSIVFSN
jgi:hypothetical protein